MSEQKTVSTLCLNPAVDVTYEVKRLVAEQKSHALTTRHDPGGNGINVGRGLARLQVNSENFCVVAGEIGLLLRRLLNTQLKNVHYEEVEGETRINSTIIEVNNRTQYQISGNGTAIPDEQLECVLHHFIKVTGQGVAVITGSTQPGISNTLYAELVCKIRDQGGLPVVDTHHETLQLAIDARPFMIKPNRYELECLLGLSLATLDDVAKEARKIQQTGVDYVCVSLGAEGALLVGPDNSYHATAPMIQVRSSVGAGDAMVAGMVAGFVSGFQDEDKLRQAVACGAGTAMQAGTELFDSKDLAKLMNEIVICSLDI